MAIRSSVLLKVVQLILDFFAAHPEMSPGLTAALAKLRTLGETLRGLTTTTQAGTARSQKGAERFLDQQQQLKFIFLQPLASLARSAYRGFPKRIAEFRIGKLTDDSREGFLTRCDAIQLALVANLADFLALGMDPAVPDQFAVALAELRALPAEVNGGRLARKQARGDIDRTADQLMAVIHQLDGLVRLKYRDDVATLAAWQVARHIPWANRATAPDTPATGAAPAGGTPAT
ncbi:MAG: hypothetical protein IPK12_15090 [Gemmatimonadetes bacterium]|nr:hypothetical protein [Gemmatimonadota bacterium]